MSKQDKPVCVIEDNIPVRKLFCTLLKKDGFDTVDFHDGNSAGKWLTDNEVSGIIMDILLPDLNGTELISIIRKIPHCKDVPIIAVTGFAQPNDREKFLELGFDSYIAKPVSTSSFVDDVKVVFEAKNK